MSRLNVHEAKAHLPKSLDCLAKGETIPQFKRSVTIAEIRPLPKERGASRPSGFAAGGFRVPPSLLKPLLDEMVAAFHG